ncbi:conserved hypothetical protein, partial [Ricinus communis]
QQQLQLHLAITLITLVLSLRAATGFLLQHKSLLVLHSSLVLSATRHSIDTTICRCICGGMDHNIEKGQNPKRMQEQHRTPKIKAIERLQDAANTLQAKARGKAIWMQKMW